MYDTARVSDTSGRLINEIRGGNAEKKVVGNYILKIIFEATDPAEFTSKKKKKKYVKLTLRCSVVLQAYYAVFPDQCVATYKRF